MGVSAPVTVAGCHKDAPTLPHPDISALWDPRVDKRWVSLVLMIEAPHSLHTHSRSSLYIYNAIQHLLLWLQVIRMLPHPDIYSLGPKSKSGCCWCNRLVSLVLMIETPTHFILIPGLLHTYII
jgi:hypothetical protein